MHARLMDRAPYVMREQTATLEASLETAPEPDHMTDAFIPFNRPWLAGNDTLHRRGDRRRAHLWRRPLHEEMHEFLEHELGVGQAR